MMSTPLAVRCTPRAPSVSKSAALCTTLYQPRVSSVIAVPAFGAASAAPALEIVMVNVLPVAFVESALLTARNIHVARAAVAWFCRNVKDGAKFCGVVAMDVPYRVRKGSTVD